MFTHVLAHRQSVFREEKGEDGLCGPGREWEGSRWGPCELLGEQDLHLENYREPLKGIGRGEAQSEETVSGYSDRGWGWREGQEELLLVPRKGRGQRPGLGVPWGWKVVEPA